MSTYNATINAKGCDKTGITEDLAAQLFNGGRSTILVIAELSVVKDHTNHVTGAKGVQLMIDTIEPVVCATNSEVEERADNDIRRVMRALYMNRATANGDAELPLGDQSDEPVLADVLAAAEAVVETDETGEVVGLHDHTKEPAPA